MRAAFCGAISFFPLEPGSILQANRRSVVPNDLPLINHRDSVAVRVLFTEAYVFEIPDNLSVTSGEANHIQSIPYTYSLLVREFRLRSGNLNGTD